MTQPQSDAQQSTADAAGLTSRRGVLAGVGVVGTVGIVGALAGCGGSGSGSTPPSPANGGQPGDIRTADIPVGGGRVYPEQNVVVTQPSSGQFKAFSAICTHAGCTVGSVSNGVIKCPCHGSQFSITDGSVKNGPASQPLPAKNVTVSGSTITVA